MSQQYDKYIAEHKDNVVKAFEWINENIPEVLIDPEENDYYNVINHHDESKYYDDEYKPYDAYFYGGNKSAKVVADFRKAFLLHIHRNPHHWQYWILKHDDPKDETIIDMDPVYIIEMICDWWSFSWKTGKLDEIFDWYDDHKDYMKLSPKTRRTVEAILNRIKDKLPD